jgi:mercuric ion binding protein
MRVSMLAAMAVVGLANVALAVDVNIKGVHLCCGGCVQGVKDALEGVEGVSKVEADANTKVVTFQAADEKGVQAGFKALAEAGFHGEATADKKPAKFPKAEIKKDTKAATITVTGVHLCCGACKTGVQKALADVKAVDEISIDQEARTVTVKGKDIDVQSFFDALYKAGYHGELKKDAEKK